MGVRHNKSKIAKFLILKALEKCSNQYHLTLISSVDPDNYPPADSDMLNLMVFGNTDERMLELKIINKEVKNFNEKRQTLIDELNKKLSV